MFSALMTTATLAATLAVPASAVAAEPHARTIVTVRTVDPYRRDVQFRQRRVRAYRAYLAERRLAYARYQRQRLAERRAYWRWRHHRDARFEFGRR
jgi:hypothetical protein